MESLLRPRLSAGVYPELPFLLRTLPVGDPLLARVSMNPTGLTPSRFEGGWALSDDIRKSWEALKRGLLYILDLLLTNCEQSSCGTSARYAIRNQSHWPHPEDFGYRKLHITADGAQTAIRRAHVAFQLLVARCSLAIALWLFPGPRGGQVPEVRSSHYNYTTDVVVPDWVEFLIKKEVPTSWIDAIGDSIICNFSFNLRVGTVLNAQDVVTLPLTPVLRGANIPVFVWWANQKAMDGCKRALPFMTSFAPASPGDPAVALQHRPVGKPRIVTLCRDGHTRLSPDFAAVDELTPPFGPYQLPGETRANFFARRERFRPDQERLESLQQKAWRMERCEHAKSGLPPYRRSRVYLWVDAQLIFPDLPPQWHGREYRYPIAPSGCKTIWRVHPTESRQYNSFFDEWDLWFPPGWDSSDPETHPRATETNDDVPRTPQHSVSSSVLSRGSRQSPIHDLDSETSLVPDDANQDGVLPSILMSWYGISITDTRTFVGIDYTTWVDRLPQIFSEHAANIPQEAEQQSLIAGWISAILAGDTRSRALMHTWDLDPLNSSYLFRGLRVQSCMSVEHVRAPSHVEETDDIVRWVLVKFKRDPDDQPWSIITTAMGGIWLARHVREVDTTRDAVLSLVSAGVPFRTGKLLKRPVPPIHALPLPSRRLMLPPWRKAGHRPTARDYDSYCQRVLELAGRPHARAAWLKGGIVWRIMRHVTGRETHIENQGDLEDGPSGHTAHHMPVTVDTQGQAYYDDSLSLEELDIIAGVVKVYTGSYLTAPTLR